MKKKGIDKKHRILWQKICPIRLPYNIDLKFLDAADLILLSVYQFYISISSKLFDTAVIHVIGDSHTQAFFFQRPFIVHYIGASTAYNIDEGTSTRKTKNKLGRIVSKIDAEKDILMLVFGEIDARIHIYYQYEKRDRQFTIEQLINMTIEKYGKKIIQLKSKGIDLCIYGIPPAAVTEKNHYGYRFYGTPAQRSAISRSFNKSLKAFCEDNGLLYIDVQSVTADPEGFIKSGYNMDDIHVNSKIVPFTRDFIFKAFNGRKKFRKVPDLTSETRHSE